MKNTKYKIIKEDIDSSSFITLSKGNTIQEAKICLIEEAKKNGGKFDNIEKGNLLVKDGNIIEEYSIDVQIEKQNWLASLIYSPNKKVRYVLIARYMIAVEDN